MAVQSPDRVTAGTLHRGFCRRVLGESLLEEYNHAAALLHISQFLARLRHTIFRATRCRPAIRFRRYSATHGRLKCAFGHACLQVVAHGVGVLLIIGLWTPFAAALQFTNETWVIRSTGVLYQKHTVSAVIGLCLAMLGPGAWSVDAHRSGANASTSTLIRFPEARRAAFLHRHHSSACLVHSRRMRCRLIYLLAVGAKCTDEIR